MRKVALGLLFFYSFTVLKFGIPFLDFAINLQEIQNELCINKDKPIAYCGGSCYLEDELSKSVVDDAEGESSRIFNSTLFDFLFFEEVVDFSFNRSELSLASNPYFSTGILIGYPDQIPHPPNTL